MTGIGKPGDVYTNVNSKEVNAKTHEWVDVSDKISFPKGTRHGTVFAITKAEFENLIAALNK